MSDTTPGARSARGITLLERTPEDEAAGIYRIQGSGGAVAELTERQMQIMCLPPAEKLRLPVEEIVAFGKIVMQLEQDNMDAAFEELNRNPPQAPEFITEPYEYVPLKQQNCIRLIQIITEDEDGMIHISMDEYDLDEQLPRYHCLSYCWSNPHFKSNLIDMHSRSMEDYDDKGLYPIACNGRLLYVRANLYDALKQLPAAPGLQLKDFHNFNGSVEKLTGLHQAAADGDVPLTKTNLFRGAYIDTKDSAGRTALSLAVINGHFPIVKILLEAGSDPQIRDYSDQTCLDYALIYHRSEIADYILSFDSGKPKKYSRKYKHDGYNLTKLWVDAICINQDDIQEKNEQVSVMDRIYSQAYFVTVWLGRDDGTGAWAGNAIEKLFSVASKSETLGQVEFEPYKTLEPAECEQIGIPYITTSEWVSLALLYLRQYFHRIWCLQEAVLNENVVMYMGEHHLPWDEFMMVTEQLHMLQRKYTIPPSSKFRPNYTAAIESEAHLISELRMRKSLDSATPERRKGWFNHTKRFWRGEDQPCQIPLLEMMFQTITFECSDPRDHIYGLLGMCKNHPESPRIEVDYARPWEELYTEIMRLTIDTPGVSKSRPFTHIKDSALYKNENLPSWVLHFGQAGVSPIEQAHFAAAGKFSEEWDAARSSSGRENELILEGRKIDALQDLATKRPGAEQVSFCNFDMTWPSLLLGLPQIYPHTQETRTEVLWRTLCGDSPNLEDVIISQKAHVQREQSTSAEPLSLSSKAPTRYSAQFRLLLFAMILSHAEKQADLKLKVRNSPGGVLLQAMVALEKARTNNETTDSNGDPIIHKIYAPTDEETAETRDISLTGPYFSSGPAAEAINAYDLLYQSDSRQFNGPGCSTPSLAGIAAFLKSPTYRIWYPDSDNHNPISNITKPTGPHSSNVQVVDPRPAGENGFHAQFARFNGGRRLFVTRDQKYLGLGGMSMQVGDEVWLVKGSKVPLLLRKMSEEEVEDAVEGVASLDLDTGGDGNRKGKERELPRKRVYYKLIGDLYVHGIMRGEAVREGDTWEDIALC